VALNVDIIRAVCEVAHGALGPNAMHKLFSPTGNIATDGLSLVKEMKFRADQPIVNSLLKALESQDREVGDGTTRMLIFLGALLEAADNLMKQGLNPSRIAEGFREAASDAVADFSAHSFRVEGIGHLVMVAETALSGKASVDPNLPRDLALSMADLAEAACGGSLVRRDTVAYELLEASLSGRHAVFKGVLLHARRGHPSAPAKIANAKVAIIDYPLDVFNKPAFASRVPHGMVESVARVGEQIKFSKKSQEQVETLVESIIASGADVVICKRGMGNLAMSLLARRGIIPIEKINREEYIRRLILATGANAVGNPSSISVKDLGIAALIEEVDTPSGHVVLVDGGTSSRTITVLVHTASAHAREACKRGVETAVGAISSTIDCRRAVSGGGAAEAAASRHLSSRSFSFRSTKQLIYRGFAEALLAIPRNLAETTGLDPFDIVSSLNSSDELCLGIDVPEKSVCDTRKKGIVDPLKVATCYISYATDFAALILGVDMLLKKPPEKGMDERRGQRHSIDPHGHSHEPRDLRYV